jgi:hypothetical protein
LSGQAALRVPTSDYSEEPAFNNTPGTMNRSDRDEVSSRSSALRGQWQDVAVLRTEPGFETTVSRRRVLTGGVALAVFAVAAPACSTPPPPPAVDELVAQLTLAQRDSELAKAAAVSAPQQINAALTEVAAERTQHARALTAEIARLAVSPTSTSAQTTTTIATTTNAPAPPPPLADVVRSLKASADSAGELASTSSGYRAGLLGSIAAACTASYSVALASGAPTS